MILKTRKAMYSDPFYVVQNRNYSYDQNIYPNFAYTPTPDFLSDKLDFRGSNFLAEQEQINPECYQVKHFAYDAGFLGVVTGIISSGIGIFLISRTFLQYFKDYISGDMPASRGMFNGFELILKNFLSSYPIVDTFISDPNVVRLFSGQDSDINIAVDLFTLIMGIISLGFSTIGVFPRETLNFLRDGFGYDLLGVLQYNRCFEERSLIT